MEWALHRYLLHKATAKYKWKFHVEHHTSVFKTDGYDSDYELPLWKIPFKVKEYMFVGIVGLIHLPLAFFVLPFYLGNVFVICLYLAVHYFTHKWPDLGWRWFPWHMEHHLVSAAKNFGVITPFWDWLFGTLQTSYNQRKSKPKE